MTILEEAKHLFNGDDKTPPQIPKAFQLLDTLIEQNNKDAILLKLDCLKEIGDMPKPISSMDVEFENNRPAGGYTDTELREYCQKGSYLAVKEKIQSLNADNSTSCVLKNALALVIAHPIVTLYEKLFSLGELDYGYTLATLYFNGKHKDYPQIDFTPDKEKGIRWLSQATLHKHRPSIIELMKIYVGMPSRLIEIPHPESPLIEFKSVNEAQNLYNYVCMTFDESAPENAAFFRTLCALIQSIATPPDTQENTLLSDVETISVLLENNHLTPARHLLEKVNAAVATNAHSLDEETLAYLNELEMILRALPHEEAPYYPPRHNPGFFEPIASGSSYLPDPASRFPQPYFPHTAIQHMEVSPQSHTPSVTLTQKTGDNGITSCYMDMIFGEGFIPADHIESLKAFFENGHTKDTAIIANEIVNCPSPEYHQQFRIWFNLYHQESIGILESLKHFIRDVLNCEINEWSENAHETTQSKGKEKVGKVFS